MAKPGRQPDEHLPAEHVSLAAHLTSHPPQLSGSMVVGMHVPLQKDWYAGHVHAPFTHD
jgi:hypothetical protein